MKLQMLLDLEDRGIFTLGH